MAEALAKTVDSLSLQTPPLNATTKNKATPTKYSEDVDDTFTFATPSGGNALFDNVVFASGKLGLTGEKSEENGDEERKRIWWAGEKSFDGFHEHV